MAEGDPGTWSHCGKREPHSPHTHSFAMNEGRYDNILCNGTPAKAGGSAYSGEPAPVPPTGIAEPTVRYGLIIAGDAMGGSRDEIRIVPEEVARAHRNDGWVKAVKITLEDI